eukprot:470986-Hanusia_phi.AAC.2
MAAMSWYLLFSSTLATPSPLVPCFCCRLFQASASLLCFLLRLSCRFKEEAKSGVDAWACYSGPTQTGLHACLTRSIRVLQRLVAATRQAGSLEAAGAIPARGGRGSGRVSPQQELGAAAGGAGDACGCGWRRGAFIDLWGFYSLVNLTPCQARQAAHPPGLSDPALLEQPPPSRAPGRPRRRRRGKLSCFSPQSC